MSKKLYLYPIWIRIWHGLNALLILTLIVTGINMQYSSPEHAFIRFDIAVSIHNICGILLTLNYLFFFIGNFITPNGKYYKLTVKGLWKRLQTQFMYYTFGIFKHQSPPFPVTKEKKFNPLQQFTYVAAMYFLVPIVVITGLALMYPEIIVTRVFGGSGIKMTDILHVLTGFFIAFFLLIHVYFCTIGATFVSNFKSMVNGYHEAH